MRHKLRSLGYGAVDIELAKTYCGTYYANKQLVLCLLSQLGHGLVHNALFSLWFYAY